MVEAKLNRRHALTMSARCAFAAGIYAWVSQVAAQPTHKISAGQLSKVLAQRFPRRFAVAGLLELQIETPILHFLPAQYRLASELNMRATGPALRRSHTGNVKLDFELRYEPSDLTIRAYRIRIHEVQLPGLTPDLAAMLDAYARQSAERALLEVVLHTLRPSDLELATTMGFEPGSIDVVSDGLVVRFVTREVR